jgi:AraC-like DNA-binding protein
VSSSERLYLRTDERRVTWPAHAGDGGAFREMDPAPGLRGHVAKVRWGREQIPENAPVKERIVPDGSIQLLFDFGADTARGLVVGASSEPTLLELAGRIEQMSIELRPGAVAALFGRPARELSGREVPLADLWRGRAAEVQERLSFARDLPARLGVVHDTLASALAAGPDPTPPAVGEALRRISRAAGNVRVRQLAAGLGISDRRLEQLFHWHVGLSPKVACRLARFRATVDHLATAPAPPSWAELALDHGFSDQAHLVNEFRALTGLAPRDFQRRAGFAARRD